MINNECMGFLLLKLDLFKVNKTEVSLPVACNHFLINTPPPPKKKSWVNTGVFVQLNDPPRHCCLKDKQQADWVKVVPNLLFFINRSLYKQSDTEI